MTGSQQRQATEVMALMIQRLCVTARMFKLSGLPSRFRPDTEEHLIILAACASATGNRSSKDEKTYPQPND